MRVIGSIFQFKFDVNKGGIEVGNFNITAEQIQNILGKCISILFILILMCLVIKIGSKVIDKFVKKQSRSNLRFTLDEKKSNTLGAVLKSVLRYAVYFFGIVAILTELFGPVSLTFAGIGGVAIGFGAQSLVKDIINGFFILFENQFNVGDYINIDEKGGIVESIELRVTKIRDFNGDLHIIPNGLISKVTNHSRGEIRFVVEVNISYEEDVDKVIEIISEVCTRLRNNNENMVDGPKVIGISELKESSIIIKVVGKAKPMTQWECEMELRKEIKKALDIAKILVPYPRRKIIKED